MEIIAIAKIGYGRTPTIFAADAQAKIPISILANGKTTDKANKRTHLRTSLYNNQT
jgi:hypothetical protein